MKRTLLIISCLLISNFIFAKKRLAVFEFDGNARDQKEKNQAIVNGPILSTDRHGRENMAYQFDGIDDYIELSKGLLNFNNSFSIETYLYSEEPVGSYTDMENRVRPDIGGTILSIDGFMDNSTDFLLLSHSGDSLSSWYNNNLISTWNITKASVHSETIYQKYRHLVLVKDEKKNKIKLYIDGELRAERSIAQKKSSAKHTPIIGMHRWIATDGLIYNNFFFKGKMDYFRIYYRALSRKKVAKMYRKESTAPYKHQSKNKKECHSPKERTDKINKSIKVYPNPSRGHVFIDADLDIDCKEVRIYNHHGKIVITSAYKNEIKVNSLKPGYYTVVLITPQRNYKRRLVIIR
jgi:hypothetical protein